MQEVNRAKNTWKNNCFTQILIKEWSSESNKIWFIISQYSSSLPLLEALPFLPLFKVPPPWKKIYSVQFLSVAQSCPTLCNPMDCSIPGLPVHHQLLDLLKLKSIESMMPSNHLILCHPLPLLPSIFPSIRVFSNELALCIRWPKYWSFSFSTSPSSEYSGLISFRIDWLDLLAVQGTLKSLLQNQSSEASVLQCSAFFIVQLSHAYTHITESPAWASREAGEIQNHH